MFQGLQASIGGPAIRSSNGAAAASTARREADVLLSVSNASQAGAASGATDTVEHILKKLTLLADAVKMKSSMEVYGSDGGSVSPTRRASSSRVELGASTPSLDAAAAERVQTELVRATAGEENAVADQVIVTSSSPRAREQHVTRNDDPHVSDILGHLTEPGLRMFPRAPTVPSPSKQHRFHGDGAPTTSRTALLQSIDRNRARAQASREGSASGERRRSVTASTADLHDVINVLNSPSTPAENTSAPPAQRRGSVRSRRGSLGSQHGDDGLTTQPVVPYDAEDAEVSRIAHEVIATGVTSEVRMLQERVDAVVGRGIPFSHIQAIYGEVNAAPMLDATLPALHLPRAISEATSRTPSAGVPAAGSPFASMEQLLNALPPPSSAETLPPWLRKREDYQRVESEAKRLGGAAQSMGLGKGGMVLVKRALETPGPARGGKDIEVLAAWLRDQEQFSHLGALQLAVVARSVIGEHLPPGHKMTPTAESIYVVLSGHLHVMRADGSGEIVGPGQSLGPRSWWGVLTKGMEKREGRLGRRISLVVAAAREEAKHEARRMLSTFPADSGASTAAQSTDRLPTAALASVPSLLLRRDSLPCGDASGMQPSASGDTLSGLTQSHSGATNTVSADMSAADLTRASSLLKKALGLHGAADPSASHSTLESGFSLDGSMEMQVNPSATSLMSVGSAAVGDAKASGTALQTGRDNNRGAASTGRSGRSGGLDASSSTLDSASLSAAALMPRRRRMSVFDASCIGRALNEQDVGTSITGLAGATRIQRQRLEGLPEHELAKLRALTVEDVLDGVWLVRLGLGEYHDTLVRHRRIVNAETARYLNERMPDFHAWGTTRLAAMARAFERRTFDAGQVIFRQGDVADSVCLLQGGNVNIYRRVDAISTDTFPTGSKAWRTQTQVQPVVIQVTHAEPGTWFGYEALQWYTLLTSLDADVVRGTGSDGGNGTARRPEQKSPRTARARQPLANGSTEKVGAITAALTGTGPDATPWERRRRDLASAGSVAVGGSPLMKGVLFHRDTTAVERLMDEVLHGDTDARMNPRTARGVDPSRTGRESAQSRLRVDSTGAETSRPDSRSSRPKSPAQRPKSPPSAAKPPPGALSRAASVKSIAGDDIDRRGGRRPSIHASQTAGALLEADAAGALQGAKRVFEALRARVGRDVDPPMREVSAIAASTCTVLYLRPEHFQLLQHKGLLGTLQKRGNALTERLNDGQLLEQRTQAKQLDAAVRMLRNEAYGPRYTRSVAEGIVLLPEHEQGEAHQVADHVAHSHTVRTTDAADGLLPEDETAKPKAWHERLAGVPHLRRTQDVLATSSGLRSCTPAARPPSSGTSVRPGTGRPASRGAGGPMPSGEHRQQQRATTSAGMHNAGADRSHSGSPTRAASALTVAGGRWTPLPTGGLRSIRVPLQLYKPLAALPTSHALPPEGRHAQQKVLTRLPVLPNPSRKLSPERVLLAKQEVEAGMGDERPPRSSPSHARLTTTEIRSRQERLALIYATASSKDHRTEAVAASVGSGVAVKAETPLQFAHMMQIRRNSVDVAAAALASAASGSAAQNMGGGSPASGRGATKAAEAISRLARLDANKLRYQSPLEKAHDDIVAEWDRQAARAIEDVVRRTYHADLDGPHSILPSYWPTSVQRASERTVGDGHVARDWQPANTGLVPTMISSPRRRSGAPSSPEHSSAASPRATGSPRGTRTSRSFSSATRASPRLAARHAFDIGPPTPKQQRIFSMGI